MSCRARRLSCVFSGKSFRVLYRPWLFGAVWILAFVCAPWPGLAQGQETSSPEQDLALGYQAFSPSANQNFTLAARHLLRAAKAGSQGAQALTGYLYLHGLGVPKSAFWATYWLELALAHPEISEQERAMAKTWLDQAKAAR